MNFFLTFSQQQIVEEVQKFYSSSIVEASNSSGTAVVYIYHKTVSKSDAWVQFTASFG